MEEDYMKIHPVNENGLRILHIYDRYMPNLGYIENYLPREEARLGNDSGVLRQLLRNQEAVG